MSNMRVRDLERQIEELENTIARQRMLIAELVAGNLETRSAEAALKAMLDLLGLAGCVSIEAGVESISNLGRNLLDKRSRLSTEEIAARLVHARQVVPFVQANLLDSQVDSPDDVETWRQHLISNGVWANKPVPLFPYPGSPEYSRKWGQPDDEAWERAVDHYLASFSEFSDIQEARPRRLADLESVPDQAA